MLSYSRQILGIITLLNVRDVIFFLRKVYELFNDIVIAWIVKAGLVK